LCCSEISPDIYAIAFQELDLTGGALLLGDTSRAAPWEDVIMNSVNGNSKDRYALVHSKQLVGMLLCVLVKQDHLPNIKEFRSSQAGCGIMGKMGNKGGVAVRFKFYDSQLCFVNSHLSAHSENFQRRNQDYRDISRRIVFTDDHGETTYSIFEHDPIFWLGDLNYRINMEDADVRKKVQEQSYEELLACDQLLLQQQKGLAFEEFSEAPINFAPTYKYDMGTTNYDSSEKRRAPAWCDRILWRGAAVVKCLEYRRHELLSSDHRPVSGLYQVNIKRVIEEKRRVVMQEIIKHLDRLENERIPQCDLSQSAIDFGQVYYMVPQTRTIQLNYVSRENETAVTFGFVPKPNSNQVCKPWLQVSPDKGVMPAGSEGVTLTFTILVDNLVAPSLNLGKDTISDILIVRLKNGVDHYIEVRGEYMPSSFGNYLDCLIRHVKPIRENTPVPIDSPQQLSIPKELWALVDYIHKNCTHHPDLFLKLGKREEVQNIIECLDTGKPLSSCEASIDSVAQSLLRFLESLAEPVIPYSMYQSCIDSCDSYLQSKQLLSSLKTVNYNVFYYLMVFFRQSVLANRDKNMLTPKALASKFAEVLLRPPRLSIVDREMDPSKKFKAERFILQFLEAPQLKVP